jgi:hypothetical protein
MVESKFTTTVRHRTEQDITAEKAGAVKERGPPLQQRHHSPCHGITRAVRDATNNRVVHVARIAGGSHLPLCASDFGARCKARERKGEHERGNDY